MALVNYISAFLIVLGLMGITLFLMKKLLGRMNHSFSVNSRINILETRYIDQKNKLVLFSCDNRQHLLMIGPTNAILLESNLKSDDSQNINLVSEAVKKIKDDAHS